MKSDATMLRLLATPRGRLASVLDTDRAPVVIRWRDALPAGVAGLIAQAIAFGEQ